MKVGDLHASHGGKVVRVQGSMGDYDEFEISEIWHNVPAGMTYLKSTKRDWWSFASTVPCKIMSSPLV